MVDLVWIRCSGCNNRVKAYKEGNVGYYHDHLNTITGGRAKNVEDKIKQTSACENCGGIIHLSNIGEWFHEIVIGSGNYRDIIGVVKCEGFVPPVATPKE